MSNDNFIELGKIRIWNSYRSTILSKKTQLAYLTAFMVYCRAPATRRSTELAQEQMWRPVGKNWVSRNKSVRLSHGRLSSRSGQRCLKCVLDKREFLQALLGKLDIHIYMSETRSLFLILYKIKDLKLLEGYIGDSVTKIKGNTSE